MCVCVKLFIEVTRKAFVFCCMYTQQEAINCIKVNFNQEFDEVFVKKELELTKIAEKNKRIKKILDDLGVNDPVYEPEMCSTEKPEMLLTTTDDEVMSVHYYYPYCPFHRQLSPLYW